MERNKVRRAAAFAAIVTALGIASGGDAAHAGSVTIATGVCATDGARVTWDHSAQAKRDATFGTIREISIVEIKTFELAPRQLTWTEVSYGEWVIQPVADLGHVTVDITIREVVTTPNGTWFEHLSTPRTTFLCVKAPPITTVAPTTAPAPETTVAQVETAEPIVPPEPPSTSIALPTTTVVGPTTEVPIGLLPETGQSSWALAAAGGLLLLTGATLAATARKRPPL